VVHKFFLIEQCEKRVFFDKIFRSFVS